MKAIKNILKPEDWNLRSNSKGELYLKKFKLTDMADNFGTPLYVLDTDMLIRRAEEFRRISETMFSGRSGVFYPFKCNAVPSVINAIKEAGLSAEVMTEFELDVALESGFSPSSIIVNGPCKTESFLLKCLKYKVGSIVIDSISELQDLIRLQKSIPERMKLLLRVNPDFIPKGMSRNSATGSRNSSFGMNEEEILKALFIIRYYARLSFLGIHFHIGTGIRDPEVYSAAISKLYPLFKKIIAFGFQINVLDVGGGFASMTTRELTSFEMIASQALSSYQLKFHRQEFFSFEDYFKKIKESVVNFFGANIPEIYFEPGRCIVSAVQMLLLRIHRIKERNGMKWLITDGGLGTITMPSYYEYHEMFLCNEFNRNPKEKVTITGPCCFASDLVYKNKILPGSKEGEVLALMDTGAYFTALESSFNFNKPAIVSVSDGECKLVRRRETFSDMINRDNGTLSVRKEKNHEILN
ncbi:MAG TPA: hypothetical protein PKA90_13815 [Ignavibacteria bacterium]|nr:hypothetical protein [Ignavibacteria bacterium]HMR41496.1 hypothetical protein [Ignavibacteria bacterium]